MVTKNLLLKQTPSLVFDAYLQKEVTDSDSHNLFRIHNFRRSHKNAKAIAQRKATPTCALNEVAWIPLTSWTCVAQLCTAAISRQVGIKNQRKEDAIENHNSGQWE